MPYHPRDEEERRKRQASKVAQSQASATPIQAQAPLQPTAVGRNQSPLAQVGQQAGAKLLQSALGSALGPLGGVLGGLFNKGGKIPMGYNTGGWLAGLFGGGPKQTNRFGREVTKPARTKTTAQMGGAKWWQNPYKQAAQQEQMRSRGKPSIWQQLGRNTGGAIPNPNGYNEGGAAMPTPIKKVMDVEKLDAQVSMDELKEDQAERAFQAQERRKDVQMQQSMKQKEEAHALQMKLKKQSATMKAPLAKK